MKQRGRAVESTECPENSKCPCHDDLLLILVAANGWVEKSIQSFPEIIKVGE